MGERNFANLREFLELEGYERGNQIFGKDAPRIDVRQRSSGSLPIPSPRIRPSHRCTQIFENERGRRTASSTNSDYVHQGMATSKRFERVDVASNKGSPAYTPSTTHNSAGSQETSWQTLKATIDRRKKKSPEKNIGRGLQDTKHALQEATETMVDNSEKLRNLEERTERIKDGGENFLKLTKQLNEKQGKTWFW